MYIKLNDLKSFYDMMDIPTIITDLKYNKVFCNNVSECSYLCTAFNPALAIEATPGAAELLNNNKPAILLRFEASSNTLAVNAFPIGSYIVFQQTTAPNAQPDNKMIFKDVSDNLDRILSLLPTLVKFGSGDILTMESFNRIHRSCFAILRTIQNADTIADLVGNCNLDNETFNISSVLKGIAEACNETCCSLPEQVPIYFVGKAEEIYVNCDKEKFSIAILNLLINSMVYTRDENQVKIECSTIGNNVLIMVSDKGMGISNEHVDRLLLPYKSKHPYDDEPGVPGVGIGITLVKEFVARYGGSFRLESEPHEYTNIIISLPRALEHEETAMQDQRIFASLIKHRFSPLYIQLSSICNLPWGDNLLKNPFETTA